MNIKNFFFPCRCPYCNRVISSKTSCCKECKKEFPAKSVELFLYNSRCIAPFEYKGIFKKAVLNFKFYGRVYYAQQMAAEINRVVGEKYKGESFDLITFIPLTSKGRKKRGYNQSEILAKELGKIMKIPCKKLLTKIFDNKPQHTLNPSDRRKNVIGVYKVRKAEKVKNKSILLIDDIATTGATLNEAVKILLQSGTESVLCAAFAISKGKHACNHNY